MNYGRGFEWSLEASEWFIDDTRWKRILRGSKRAGRFDILVEWKLFLSVWQFLIAFCGSLIIRSKYYIFFRMIDFCRLFPSFELLIIPKVITVLIYLSWVLYVIRKIYWWIVIYWLNQNIEEYIVNILLFSFRVLRRANIKMENCIRYRICYTESASIEYWSSISSVIFFWFISNRSSLWNPEYFFTRRWFRKQDIENIFKQFILHEGILKVVIHQQKCIKHSRNYFKWECSISMMIYNLIKNKQSETNINIYHNSFLSIAIKAQHISRQINLRSWKRWKIEKLCSEYKLTIISTI